MGGVAAVVLTQVAPQATEGVLAKPDGDLQPAGLPTATPEAAAALAALQQEARRAQAEFCANHPVLAAEGEALERVMGHPPPPYDSVAYPMWVHTSADIVSQEIKKKGYWEEEDTLELLMKLETFQQVRSPVCAPAGTVEAASSWLAASNAWEAGTWPQRGMSRPAAAHVTLACAPCIASLQAHGLRREDVVLLDIGANVGWYTVTAAALGYTVVAFEPMAPNLAALRRSLCDSPDLMERVTLVPRGLSNTTQDCVFWVAGQNQGNGYARCGPDARSSGGLPG